MTTTTTTTGDTTATGASDAPADTRPDVTVKRVAVGSGTFTIHLTGATGAATPVAWTVIQAAD